MNFKIPLGFKSKNQAIYGILKTLPPILVFHNFILPFPASFAKFF